jgi:hypothetical protein
VWSNSTIWLVGAVITGLYCDVTRSTVIVILQSLVLQDGKRVIVMSTSLVDRSQLLDVSRCGWIMGCAWHPGRVVNWKGVVGMACCGACHLGRSFGLIDSNITIVCAGAHHPW